MRRAQAFRKGLLTGLLVAGFAGSQEPRPAAASISDVCAGK